VLFLEQANINQD